MKLEVSVKSEKVVVFAARTILIVRLKADTEPIHYYLFPKKESREALFLILRSSTPVRKASKFAWGEHERASARRRCARAQPPEGRLLARS